LAAERLSDAVPEVADVSLRASVAIVARPAVIHGDQIAPEHLLPTNHVAAGIVVRRTLDRDARLAAEHEITGLGTGAEQTVVAKVVVGLIAA
jgi:hypothetical protein